MRRSLLGLLRLFGWSTTLVWPTEPKGIILVYPHTSNWDFIVGVMFRIGHGLPASWIGIDTYLHLSGDPEADFAQIRAFYADKRGCHPEPAGEIRLRERNGLDSD